LEVAKVVQNIVKGTPYVDLRLFNLTSKIEKIEKVGPVSFEFPDQDTREKLMGNIKLMETFQLIGIENDNGGACFNFMFSGGVKS